MTPPAPATTAAELTRRELHERVLTFVARRVGSREDAEDIAQEVMLRIHRHSADLEHADRMTAWVYRIAANAIADHYRRPARRERAGRRGCRRDTAQVRVPRLASLEIPTSSSRARPRLPCPAYSACPRSGRRAQRSRTLQAERLHGTAPRATTHCRPLGTGTHFNAQIHGKRMQFVEFPRFRGHLSAEPVGALREDGVSCQPRIRSSSAVRRSRC